MRPKPVTIYLRLKGPCDSALMGRQMGVMPVKGKFKLFIFSSIQQFKAPFSTPSHLRLCQALERVSLIQYRYCIVAYCSLHVELIFQPQYLERADYNC